MKHEFFKLIDSEFLDADQVEGTPPETLETAGCTGSCQSFDDDGLPDCEECYDFKKYNYDKWAEKHCNIIALCIGAAFFFFLIFALIVWVKTS